MATPKRSVARVRDGVGMAVEPTGGQALKLLIGEALDANRAGSMCGQRLPGRTVRPAESLDEPGLLARALDVWTSRRTRR